MDLIDSRTRCPQHPTMRPCLFLLAFFVAYLLAFAPVRSAPPRAPAPCTASRSESPAIARIQADPDAWIGRCVRLRGIAAAGRLYADRPALAETLRPSGKPATGSIVIYPVRAVPRPARAASVELVGRIGSCAYAHAAMEGLRAEQPDQILMVGGYCHTSLETYVEPAQIRRLGTEGVRRLVEAELPPSRRALVEAPAGLPGAEAHLAAARRLIASIAAADEVEFRRLVTPSSQDELEKLAGAAIPGWLRQDMADARRLFVAAAARQSGFGSANDWKPFVERVALDGWKKSPREAPTAFVICGCRTASCAGRWPVSPLDADRAASRPYLCFRTVKYTLGPGRATVIRIDLEPATAGFEEPVWEP